MVKYEKVVQTMTFSIHSYNLFNPRKDFTCLYISLCLFLNLLPTNLYSCHNLPMKSFLFLVGYKETYRDQNIQTDESLGLDKFMMMSFTFISVVKTYIVTYFWYRVIIYGACGYILDRNCCYIVALILLTQGMLFMRWEENLLVEMVTGLTTVFPDQDTTMLCVT